MREWARIESGHGMPRPLPWNIGFAIGHPEIDAQHRHLIQLINQIIAAVEQDAVETLPAMLSALAEAAAEHFRTEMSALGELRSRANPRATGRVRISRLSQALANAELDAHAAEHAVQLAQLNGFRTLSPTELCERLREWFVNHAIRQDSRLRSIFQAI